MQQLRSSRFNRFAGAVVMSLVALQTLSQVYAASLQGEAAPSARVASDRKTTDYASRPKLVLSIVVDQLRTDYLEYLQQLMGEEGFRRLMTQGVYLRDVDFGVSGLDAVSGTSMIYTGAYPNVNGVTGASRYDAQALRNVPSLQSATAGYSPENLKLSTISDEVAIDGAGLATIYAIAADPQQAVVMAGHAGTGAFRLDASRGNWATLPYYGDNQQASFMLSRRPSLSARIDTMQWKPILSDLSKYPGIPAQKRQYPFRHTFPSRARDVYDMFAASARCNEEVTTLAIDCIRTLSMGKRDVIDMLNIAYTAAPFKYVKDGDYRLELEDTYLRLDLQLARLLNAVDQYVGADNAVVMLTSTGYYDDATPVDARYRIPAGDFSARRAMSLLNSFYCARYGNADYVAAYENGRFHLNRKLLQQRDIPLTEAAEAGKDFLERMSGVAEAYTTEEVTSSSLPALQPLQRITDPREGGDIIISVTPGWNLIDDTRVPSTTTPVRLSATETPAFFMAPSLTAVTIDTPVDATALAPTFSRILRIRSPNGAAAKPVKLDASR